MQEAILSLPEFERKNEYKNLYNGISHTLISVESDFGHFASRTEVLGLWIATPWGSNGPFIGVA